MRSARNCRWFARDRGLKTRRSRRCELRKVIGCLLRSMGGRVHARSVPIPDRGRTRESEHEFVTAIDSLTLTYAPQPISVRWQLPRGTAIEIKSGGGAQLIRRRSARAIHLETAGAAIRRVNHTRVLLRSLHRSRQRGCSGRRFVRLDLRLARLVGDGRCCSRRRLRCIGLCVRGRFLRRRRGQAGRLGRRRLWLQRPDRHDRGWGRLGLVAAEGCK